MKILMKKSLLMLGLLCGVSASFAQVRKEVYISNGWLFSRDSVHWEKVRIPHDWAIGGPFDKKWDLQTVAIEQNGEKVKTEKTGRTGSLPWIGRGYYVLRFKTPALYQKAILHFDGAMSEPCVYVNQQLAGKWAYGYSAFRVDITPYLRHDGKENVMVVSLRNREQSSRWYPGGGLYRPVKLILTGKTHLDQWETFIHTVSADLQEAVVSVQSTVVDDPHGNELWAFVALKDGKGNVVASQKVPVDSTGKMSALLKVSHPKLWSPETPALYQVETCLYQGQTLLDRRTDKTGIRTVVFTRDKGFLLNGVSRKFKGVCLHHDLGPLGAAVNRAALVRQVKILKDMGCDAIRTSHNMPSTMQMEVYDSLGMMVMAESFDAWKSQKVKNGYGLFFDEWAEKDMENLVRNQRNHPSLVLYSIGNEIPEQWEKGGPALAWKLQHICHVLDPTRKVTVGMNIPVPAIQNGFAQVVDIPGFNYNVHDYAKAIDELPQGFILSSETCSTVSSRGVYKFPVKEYDHKEYEDGQCSSYDLEYCPWSNVPEVDFRAQDSLSYTLGQFVWTGFDYLGEPTPYDTYWPSRSSYFGICDLAGLPKDRYYLYRSVWNKGSHTLHLLPHWNWQGMEGKEIPVYCYTDYDEAELFVNGKSQGRIHKDSKSLLDTYRLRWNHVVYEPGELKVVAYKDGKPVGEETVHTAGAPAKILLEPDKTVMKADQDDLCFITVTMTDKNGNVCPNADDEIEVSVSGAGRLEALCNGDATSLESFKGTRMKLFHGKLVLVVRSGVKHGTIKVKVKGGKNLSAACALKV